MSNTTNPSSTHASDPNQTRRTRRRIKLIDIALLPCYIPIACAVCLVMGGQCLWSYFSPTGQGFTSRQVHKKSQRLFEKEAPRPLPAVRKRALSIPLPQTEGRSFWRKEQKTLDQAQSSLFGRLPLEVRELIYGFYLTPDGGRMHVFRRTDRRLGHCFCTKGPESHSHYPNSDWGYDNPSRTRAWQRNASERPVCSNDLLPLLKSCRRV